MNYLYLVANQVVNRAVINFVAQVTEKTNATLQILLTAEKKDRLQEIEKSLERYRAVISDVDYTLTAVVEDPVKAMQDAMQQTAFDLVLMGVHRRYRVVPSNFRFMAQRVIKNCPVPIMLIRRASRGFERMLVCTGGKEISQPVVDLSAKLASTAGLKATLLNVTPVVPSMYTGMGEMDEPLDQLLETETPLAQHLRKSAELLAHKNIPAEIEIRQGDVVEAILEEAKQGDYDLIVLGKTRGQTLRGLLLGNVTQQIVNRAASAVLIAK